MIPKAFQERMKKMLPKEEQAVFFESYERERYQGLRFNPLKGRKDVFLSRHTFCLQQVLWEENGFYYDTTDLPGKHPYHQAGVYYIQEPSAMAPAAYLRAQPGERILDLCAAPGGKSTQIAAAMQGKGLLIANEIHPARAKILSENIERMGIKNALVVNETPQALRRKFGCFFHRIMVDAPCSGEGLFRKQQEACEEWSTENVRMCGERQDEILEQAYHMLLPGGRMVYSTCTFAPEENEGSISRFLHQHRDMSVVHEKRYAGMGGGESQWFYDFSVHDEDVCPADGLEETFRLWPHKLKGEGHYVAVLQKEGVCDEKDVISSAKNVTYKDLPDLQAFAKEVLIDDKELREARFLLFGEQVYLVPAEMPDLKGLKVLRPGLHLGTRKKNRMEPSHAWALALQPKQVKRVCDLSAESEEVRLFLQGETISFVGEKGWHLICVDGYSLGWGKLVGNTMKNHYPKGLRR